MWIRSQNKKVLVASDYVEIMQLARSDNLYCDECEIVTKKNGEYITLGSYSAKEKALKVLDMIQRHISNETQVTRVFNNFSKEYSYDYNIENIVFKMPKDEEVKI